jgi:hypothetical protein
VTFRELVAVRRLFLTSLLLTQTHTFTILLSPLLAVVPKKLAMLNISFILAPTHDTQMDVTSKIQLEDSKL